MDGADFDFLADLLRRRSGLHLRQDKLPLVESRLLPVAQRFGFREVASLVAELRHGRETIAGAVTEAMTTNESSFFRDKHAFEYFQNTILPMLLARRAGQRRLRIWCAGAANGQEAYSLAMILDDLRLPEAGWTVDLHATDLSSAAIARAKEGLYSQFEVQRGLPIQRLVRHFAQEGEQWRIAQRLRRMVSFRQFNLLDSFGWLGALDVIFCRNVLIYFDMTTKMRVIDRLADSLAPDGWLVLGATESLAGASSAFAPVDDVRGVYVRAAQANARMARLAG